MQVRPDQGFEKDFGRIAVWIEPDLQEAAPVAPIKLAPVMGFAEELRRAVGP